MKKIIKTFLFFMVAFSIGSCQPPASPTPPDYKDNEAQDKKNREKIIQTIRDSYSGPTCTELDNKNQEDCEEICRELYKRTRDRKDCEKLEVDLIEDLEKMYKNLKEADELSDIAPSLFKAYLNISILGLKNIAEKFSLIEAERFLLWVIKNQKLGTIFRDKDSKNEVLEVIFETISNYETDNDDSDLHKPFIKRLDGDELMEIAIISDNVEVVEWLMDFINDKETCDDQDTKNCFAVYCKIGSNLNKDTRKNWLNYDVFIRYIKDIIDKKVNSKDARSSNNEKYNARGWDDSSIDGLNDIKDWVDDLCYGLT